MFLSNQRHAGSPAITDSKDLSTKSADSLHGPARAGDIKRRPRPRLVKVALTEQPVS